MCYLLFSYPFWTNAETCVSFGDSSAGLETCRSYDLALSKIQRSDILLWGGSDPRQVLRKYETFTAVCLSKKGLIMDIHEYDIMNMDMAHIIPSID